MEQINNRLRIVEETKKVARTKQYRGKYPQKAPPVKRVTQWKWHHDKTTNERKMKYTLNNNIG